MSSSDGMAYAGIDFMLLRTDASIVASAAVGRADPTGTPGPEEYAGSGAAGDAVDGDGDGDGTSRDGARADCGGGAAAHEATASSASPYPAPRATSPRACPWNPIRATPVVEPEPLERGEPAEA
ncbi:hypothetical protein ACIPJK_24280 [Streptomyces roseus]|uniref:hypothetical protein n=1 Tax=Streptomyces roseus TaxID=66430 RepID=UPI00381AD538